jgi:hypothetical protein
MKQLLVISIFKKTGNACLQISKCHVIPKRYFLRLYGFYKTLNMSVVKRIFLVAHADLILIKFQSFDIIPGSILNATIGNEKHS